MNIIAFLFLIPLFPNFILILLVTFDIMVTKVHKFIKN